MADLTINTANVAPGTPASTFTGFVGGSGLTVNAGMCVYQDTNNQWQPAYSSGNVAQSGNSACAIATDSAQSGQPIVLFRQGYIKIGATVTVGQTYLVSATNTGGKIMPITDVATNNYVTILGVAVNTTYLQTPPGGPFATGVQHA